MRWGLDGDIILYSVAFAAKDDPIAFACRSVRSACETIMVELQAEGIEILSLIHISEPTRPY